MRVRIRYVLMSSKPVWHPDIFLNSELYLPKDVSYVVFKYKHLVAIKIKANSITITGERWASIL